MAGSGHYNEHAAGQSASKAKITAAELSATSIDQEDLDQGFHLHRRTSWRQRYIEGWRAGATASCITAVCVLIINVTLLIWAANRYHTVKGIGTIYSGSCATAKSRTTWLQLVVNVLSSTVLGASNYCMQCLSSPTRCEVDKAHARGQSLDIGIPSIQNLKAINWKRRWLWVGLVANIYSVTPINEEFVATGGHSSTTSEGTDEFRNAVRDSARDILAESYQADTFENLTSRQCYEIYHKQYSASRGDVLVVQKELVSPTKIWKPFNEVTDLSRIRVPDGPDIVNTFKDVPASSHPSEYPSYYWQCTPRLDRTCALVHPGDGKSFSWKPYGNEVQYCWSEKVQENCKLNYSIQFAVIVIISNLAKVICMLWTLWHHDTLALITIGDAIQSFLDRPDPYTRDFCGYQITISSFCSSGRKVQGTNNGIPDYDGAGVPFLSIVGSYAVQWYVLLLTMAVISYFSALRGRLSNWRSLRDLGLGAPMGDSILSINTSLFGTVLIANIPQVILSYVYILFNSLYTCMLAGHEWTQFSKHRKTLRGSSPVGVQRSTYWLQLPYQYSVPLIVLSSLLSSLASQSLFAVKIDVLSRNGIDGTRTVQPDESILSCRFSPGAILLAIIVATLIMLGAGALGLRKYTSEMPIAATCSAAISAACYATDDYLDAAVLPIQWGVASKKNGIGHCFFSSKLVAPPIPGQMYL
ncbi:MAG: hypothetical protein Q9219_004390 [cf. Caloplaca sp. 3 TL-2023]